MNEDDKVFFEELISDGNFLGAAQFLKELDLSKARRSAMMGKVVQASIEDLGRARGKNDRERVVFLRSVTAWLLKEYPGLASLYREQLRLASGSPDVLPEIARGARNLGDVLSGKKTIQEGVEDAAEPLESFADQAGNFIRDGLSQVGDFFANLNRDLSSSGSGEADENESSSEKAEASTDARPVDITVEDADDPLPHDIHDARKAGKDGDSPDSK